MMKDLIPPHGGLSEPVDRLVPVDEIPEFRRLAAVFAKVPVSDADLSSLCRIGDGGLSPLTGPMDGATFNRALDGEVLMHNGKAYAWTIPISFPVAREQAQSLRAGETVALVDSKGAIVGTLIIRDIFPF